MASSKKHVNYICPYCQKRHVQTAVKTPFVRGILLMYIMGRKQFVGCVPCVRLKILKEVGWSLLIGWFSLTALVINPFLIIFNLIRAIFVHPNVEKVHKILKRAGVPTDPSYIRVTSLSYGLASAMITADGKIEDEEVVIAEEIGKKLFEDFNTEEFRETVYEYKHLPSAEDLAGIIKDGLDDISKSMIFNYLYSIANADGEMAKEEAELLERIAEKMNYTPPNTDTSVESSGE